MTPFFMRCAGSARNVAIACAALTALACSTKKSPEGGPATGGTGSFTENDSGLVEDAGSGGSGGSPEDSGSDGASPVTDARTDAQHPTPPEGGPSLGCESSFDCSSGVCEIDGDCYRCLSDDECSPGRVCSTGTCIAPCETEADCPNGWLCCDNRCADPERDFDHCRGCGNACSGDSFCGVSGCAPAGIGAVCDAPRLTILLDGLPTDDAVSQQVATALANTCPSPPPATLIGQDDSGLIHAGSGRPVAGSGQLVLVMGGTFGQKLVGYLEQNAVDRIYNTYDPVAFLQGFSQRGVSEPIVNVPQATLTESHSYFLIESVVEPTSHTWVVELYGLNAAGTAAAAWFFENRVLTDLAALESPFYVYEWTDSDADLAPGEDDTFTLLAP